MTNTATLDLLTKCEEMIQKSISSIKNVLPSMQNPEFKLTVLESKDALKHCELTIKNKLSLLQQTENPENKVSEKLSKLLTQTKLLAQKTDAHIAELLFDTCNECLKVLYKITNQTLATEPDSKKMVQEIITILLSLQNKLATYL